MSNLKNHLPIVHLICPAEIISGGVYCLLFFTLTLIQKRQRKKKSVRLSDDACRPKMQIDEWEVKCVQRAQET